MFSGLKYIFGYTDEAVSTSPSASASTTNETIDQSGDNAHLRRSSIIDRQVAVPGSALLEQTLNAATTKFTEQLLPPQASIEQLQSSSQHLLPSIIEQHEEDEMKKKNLSGNSIASDENANVDDDDDCSEVYSWEMLDLVDKTVGGSKDVDSVLVSTVQVDESSYEICKSTTSGILKSGSAKALLADRVLQKQQARQKPKVSFETHDLVNDKQINNREIEQHEQQIIETKTTNEDTLSKTKSNKKIGVVELQMMDLKTTKDSEMFCEKEMGKENESNDSIGTPTEVDQSGLVSMDKYETIIPMEASQTVARNSVPALNYAAAVSKKPVERKAVNVEKEVVLIEPSLECSSTNSSASRKRNRTLSTSGWLPSDDSESMDKSTSMADESCFQAMDDDNESVVSSGFSDCDYNHEAINDYYLRPRKASSKRGRSSSSASSYNSNSLSTSMSKRSSDKARGDHNVKVVVPSKSTKLTESVQAKPMNVGLKASGRSKKKRLNQAASSQDFLKKSNKRQEKVNLATQTEPAIVCASSNDSSDLADMDESWYVTPPPCFTGADKSVAVRKQADEQPISGEAARENELIEHPSIPLPRKSIASDGIKVSVAQIKVAKRAAIPLKAQINDPVWDDDDISCEDDLLVMQEDAWIPATRRVNGKQPKNKASKEAVETNVNEKASTKRVSAPTDCCRPSGRVTDVRSTTSKKAAWFNKFTVGDDWNFDDCEDADSDFDNMFEPVKKKKVVSKSKKHKQKQQEVSVNKVEQADLIRADSDLNVCFCEPSSSCKLKPHCDEAELTSTKLSPSFDSCIEYELNLVGDDKENKQAVIAERRPPTLVRPIDPERRPGWQLKRQRSKRRPLTGTTSSTPVPPSRQRTGKRQLTLAGRPKCVNDRTGSIESSSARSTPTLIGRIGSSIVANLNNLTSGLVASGALHSSSVNSVSLADDSPSAAAASVASCKSTVSENFLSKKRMSKSFMKRQNICAKQANSQRRPDRRLKMFSTPNGCSVNRKVQSNFPKQS